MLGVIRGYGWTAAFVVVEIYLLVRGLWLGAIIAGAWFPLALAFYAVVRRRERRGQSKPS